MANSAISTTLLPAARRAAVSSARGYMSEQEDSTIALPSPSPASATARASRHPDEAPRCARVGRAGGWPRGRGSFPEQRAPCWPRKPGTSALGRRCASRRESGFVWSAPRWCPLLEYALRGNGVLDAVVTALVLARSGVSVGRRPHRFVNDGLLVRVGALRIGAARRGRRASRLCRGTRRRRGGWLWRRRGSGQVCRSG